MRSSLALVRKDLKGYFDQLTGYILLIIFVGLASFLFFFILSTNNEASMRALFSVIPFMLAVFVPASTMRLLAEELRDGTLELLLTQPIRAWMILGGKFAAGLAFVSIAIALTAGIPILLSTAGDLDPGATAIQYVGSILLAASFVAIGLFTSSLTQNQIMAFMLALTINMILVLAGMPFVAVALPPALAAVLQDLSPLTHFDSVARGVLTVRDVLYFVALISVFLSGAFMMLRGKTVSHRAALYRNLQLGTAGLIVASLIVGWFGNSIGGRWDLTQDKLYTLSPATDAIVDDLDDLLTITMFASDDPPVQLVLVKRDVSDFLDDLSAKSDRVRVIRKSPGVDEDGQLNEDAIEAALSGIRKKPYALEGGGEVGFKDGFLGLSMTYTDRRETISLIETIDGLEYRVASLANKMARLDKKTVAFLKGNGQKELNTSFQFLGAQLSQQYELVEIDSSGETPMDLSEVDVVVIAGPTEEVPELVEQELHRYIASGGRALIMIDSVLVDIGQMAAIANENSFEEFVSRYGVVIHNNLVYDTLLNQSISFTTREGSVLLPYHYWVRVSPVETKISGSSGSVILPWASDLDVIQSVLGSSEIIPLLQTGDSGVADYNYRDISPIPSLDELDQRNRELGNLDIRQVGLAAVGGPDNGGSDSFRLIVVGDSDWLSDPVLGQADGENIVLGLNWIDWLAQEDTLAGIRSKVITSRQVRWEESSVPRGVVQYINVAGIPVALIVIGVLMLIRRKNSSQRVYGREE